MPVLSLDQDECWVLHEWVRQDRGAPTFGQEHDLAFVQKLWRAITFLEAPEQAGATSEIEFTRGELLQITRQVSIMVSMGSRPIGREVLRKGFVALLNDMEVGHVQIPDAFRDAYPDNADYAAGGGADAETFSG